MNINIKQAREYFDLGVVNGFQALPVEGGWVVLVHGKDGLEWSLETALRKIKVFTSLDTLLKQIDEIKGSPSSIWISCATA